MRTIDMSNNKVSHDKYNIIIEAKQNVILEHIKKSHIIKMLLSNSKNY